MTELIKERQHVTLEDLITYVVVVTAKENEIDFYPALRCIVEENFQILPQHLRRTTYNDASLCVASLHGKWTRNNIQIDGLTVGDSQCEIEMHSGYQKGIINLLNPRMQQLKQQVCTSSIESFKSKLAKMKNRVYVPDAEFEELVNLLNNILKLNEKESLDQFLEFVNFVVTEITSSPPLPLTDIWPEQVVKPILQILQDYNMLENHIEKKTLLLYLGGDTSPVKWAKSLKQIKSFKKTFAEMKKRVYVSPAEIEELVNLFVNILENPNKKILDQFLNYVFTEISRPPSSHPSLTDVWLKIVKAILQVLKDHNKLEHMYQDRTLLFEVALNMASSRMSFSIGSIRYPSKTGYFREILEHLITLGANVNVRGPTGKTVLEYLRDNSHLKEVAEVLKLLREKEASPSDNNEGINDAIANSGFFKGGGSSSQDDGEKPQESRMDLTS